MKTTNDPLSGAPGIRRLKRGAVELSVTPGQADAFVAWMDGDCHGAPPAEVQVNREGTYAWSVEAADVVENNSHRWAVPGARVADPAVTLR